MNARGGLSVEIFKDGKSMPSKIQRMFGSHGPFVIEHYRLDRLESADILRDASTVTIKSASTGEQTSQNGDVVTRAVVGGLIAGSAGAVIGGVTGKKSNTSTATTTTQSTNMHLYMSLRFKGEATPTVIQLWSETAFQRILACVSENEWTQSQIDEAKLSSEATILKQKAQNEWLAKNRAEGEAKAAEAQAQNFNLFSTIFCVIFFFGLAIVAGFSSLSALSLAIIFAAALALGRVAVAYSNKSQGE